MVDNLTYKIIQSTGKNYITGGQLEFPPLTLRDDALFTNVILPRLNKYNRMKLCKILEWIEKMAEEVDEDAHGRDDKVGFLFFGLFARFFQARPSHFKISLHSCSPERTSTLPPTSA